MPIWYILAQNSLFFVVNVTPPIFWQFFTEKFKVEKELKNYGKLSETLTYKAFIRLS